MGTTRHVVLYYRGRFQPCRYLVYSGRLRLLHPLVIRLEGIQGSGSGPPTERQVKDYMTLALHLVQELEETIE